MREYLIAMSLIATPAAADVITVDSTPNPPPRRYEPDKTVVVVTERELGSGKRVIIIEDGSDLGEE